jgi:hypothetical protein
MTGELPGVLATQPCPSPSDDAVADAPGRGALPGMRDAGTLRARCGLVVGIANERAIAFAGAVQRRALGAESGVTHLGAKAEAGRPAIGGGVGAPRRRGGAMAEDRRGR